MSNQQPPDNSVWERRVGLGMAFVVMITFIVLIFNPPPQHSLIFPIVRFLAALVAALSAYLFVGNIGLEGELPFSKLQIRAAGTFSVFITVLILFGYGIPLTPSPNNGLPQSTVIHGQDAGIYMIWEENDVGGSQPQGVNYYEYRNRQDTSLCLAVRGNDNHAPGTGVEVYDCGTEDSKWYKDDTGVITYIDGARHTMSRIKNKVSNLCLGVRGLDSHSAGAEVEVFKCDGQDSHWYFREIESRKQFQIKNRVSQLCLGVVGVDKPQRGAAVEVYHCQRRV